MQLLFFPSMGTKSIQYNPPMGLMYISAVMKTRGIRSKIIDCNVEKLDLKSLIGYLIKFQPRFVGISMMTCQVANGLRLAKDIKKIQPDVKIVGGGSHISSTMDEIFWYSDDFDYLVYGEGESTFADIVEGIPPKDIKGLIHKEGEKIKINPPRPFLEDLDTLPYIDHESIDKSNYVNYSKTSMKYVTIMVSRGCPYSCIYCSTPGIQGRRVRQRSVEDVIAEILIHVKDGHQRFKFTDGTFTINRKFILDLCHEITERKLDIKWMCLTRADLVDQELLHIMKAAGLDTISYGIESGSERVLSTLGKSLDLKQIKDAVMMSNSAGLNVGAYFMIGFPDERPDDIEATIDLSRSLGLDYAFFSILCALPGTEVYSRLGSRFREEAARKIYLTGEELYINYRKMSILQQEKWKKKALSRFYMRPRMVLKHINEIRGVNDLKKKSRALKRILGVG